MRVTKEYDERKNEIIDTAERLFHIKGYDNCTINDILKHIGIAKGTFYHYFKSKEELLDAVVWRYKDIIVNKVNLIIKIEGISPEEKMVSLFNAMNITNQIGDDILDNMHKTENALLHQKILKETVKEVAPILAKNIEEGIKKGIWRCRYPLEYMQIFLTAAVTLMDDSIFELDADSKMKTMVALISMFEKMLEVPKDYFMKLVMKNQE